MAAWIKKHLPPRPEIAQSFDADYPDCVKQLRSNPGSDSGTDATSCRSDLERHKIKYISSYYTTKLAYDEAILDEQRKLSLHGLTEEERALYNFLQQENEDLNYAGGQTLKTLTQAEARINADIEFCRSLQG